MKARLNKLMIQYEAAVSQAEQEHSIVERTKARLEATIKAQEFLQELAQEVEQQTHKQISKVVSRCISSVFGEEHSFKIEFVRKRGKTEAILQFLKDGRIVNPHQNSWGMMGVAALALRLICLTLSSPAPRKVLFLDEPFQGLSAKNKPKIAQLLTVLSKELGVQFICVTHDSSMECGKVTELKG
jgi:ABC-type molybdenum transport system ATPase subunit/photorepair protein PhrA